MRCSWVLVEIREVKAVTHASLQEKLQESGSEKAMERGRW